MLLILDYVTNDLQSTYEMLINEKLARIWRMLDATDATFTNDKRESENLPTLLTFDDEEVILIKS